MTVNEEIEQIVFSEQCWSDHTRLCIYEDFIKKMNLESAFLTYIKEIAAETESSTREGFGVVPCEYCGEKDCNFSCDESQAGGFQ